MRKKITVTYHMRSILSPRSTVETCIDLPVKTKFAEELVQPLPTVHADTALRLVDSICDALALLQGYDESVIVDIRYDTNDEEVR